MKRSPCRSEFRNAGGDRRFLAPLLEHFGNTILTAIDSQAIDAAVIALYPDAPGATRNRQVYTPVSAVLKHAGEQLEVRTPAGA
ncbi:MAG: hypothetical protein M5U07_06365 [Xanthobacteraceae bacterium]|nr:hypothetical protein [Burkholderiales bacterium]MCZ7657494.1 hypothetical protein [Xanthobacteraceae bacterium]